MAIVSYRTDAVKLAGGGNVYAVDGFSGAEYGIKKALEDGRMVPTVPLLVGMEGTGENVISSSLRISMKRGDTDVSVYMHIPLQGRPDTTFLEDYGMFLRPDITEVQFGKLINLGTASDDEGNMPVYVVDNKMERKHLKKIEGRLKNKEPGKPFVSAASMEDIWGLQSVYAFFGGQENFEKYAERHGISEINLFHLFDSVKRPYRGSTRNRKIDKLALIDGSPGSFTNSTKDMELYCLDSSRKQQYSWKDFLKTGKLLF